MLTSGNVATVEFAPVAGSYLTIWLLYVPSAERPPRRYTLPPTCTAPTPTMGCGRPWSSALASAADAGGAARGSALRRRRAARTRGGPRAMATTGAEWGASLLKPLAVPPRGASGADAAPKDL